MPRNFVDSVAWIALVNTRDSLHEKAKEVFADLRQKKISSLLRSSFCSNLPMLSPRLIFA
ncbi:MAG: hypothetical protein LH614_01195 [Pyrinomonadaceae bacterium]|nr:hypothetical protein [Pyrinomonadaceae bacterium]